MKTTLNYPDGNSVTNPDRHNIEALLSQPEDYYVSWGCGEASIDYRSTILNSLLGIRYRVDCGFSFEWCEMLAGTSSYGPSYISCHASEPGKPIEISIGGSPAILPGRSFLDKKLAETLITHFLTSGCKPELVDWSLIESIPSNTYRI
jgi:hypothetical protein